LLLKGQAHDEEGTVHLLLLTVGPSNAALTLQLKGLGIHPGIQRH
jgi:hypothetical protein